MMSRRTLLQLAGLGGLATLGAPLLTSCGGSSPGGFALASSDVAFSVGDPSKIGPAVTGMTDLGAALLGRLDSAPGNLALSPYSIALALAMTVNGAKGATRTQMLDVLGGDQTAGLNEGMAALIHHLDGLTGERKNSYGKAGTVDLTTANSLFGQLDTAWEPAFLDAVKAYYDAPIRMVDYKADPEACRTTINSWVADQTHDRIPALIPEGVFDVLTRLTLVNALYFKAPWFNKFDKSRTQPGDFHLADGKTTTADMMRNLVENVGAVEHDDWQTVRLPYAGEELAMSIVLPRPGKLASVWSLATSGHLNRLLAVKNGGAVDLTLPKWSFRTQSPLAQALESIGMKLAFDSGRADLSGMTTEEQLYVQAVLHEVFIAVDEEGTEAAAATAVVAGATAAQVGFEMVVDRPFLFVIHDVANTTPLFVGRVMDPTA
jgi:serpin B